jgi:hypothetical protein
MMFKFRRCAGSPLRVISGLLLMHGRGPLCAKNPIRVAEVMESLKLAK